MGTLREGIASMLSEDIQEVIPGRIVVAPQVLRDIVRQTVAQIPGVARLAEARVGPWALSEGLRLTMADDRVRIDLALVVRPEVRFREVARQVQEEVARAIRDLTGLEVAAVNVLIVDVEVEERGAPQTSGSDQRA